MNPTQFKKHCEVKVIPIPASVKRFLHMETIECFSLRIDELTMKIEDALANINDRKTIGYQVGHLQRRVREMEELKGWNEKLLNHLTKHKGQ